jgi:uncharacterized phage infection (PIP) family protein YhgE
MVGKISDIYGEIRLHVNKMQQDLSLAQRKLNTFTAAVGPAFRQLGMIVAAAGAAISAAIMKSTLDMVRYGIEIDKASKVTNVAAETFQELAYAAKQEHGNMESLEKGLSNLTIRLGYAGDGLETYTRYFKTLGIEYKNADGTLRKTEDVFMDIADAAHKGTMTTEKLAAIQQLFGARMGKDLIPMLKLGSQRLKELGDEARGFGIIMSEESIKAAKEFSDKITLLKEVINGLKRAFATQLLPVLNALVKTFLKPENITHFRDAMIDFGKTTAMVLQKLPSAIGTVRLSFESLEHILLQLRKDFAILARVHTGWWTETGKMWGEVIKDWDKEIAKNEENQGKIANFYGNLQSQIDNTVASFEKLGKTKEDFKGHPFFDPEAMEKIKETQDKIFEKITALIDKMSEAKDKIETDLIESIEASREEEEAFADKFIANLLEEKEKTEQLSESMGELWGTAIRSGGNYLEMLKKVIGQQIRLQILSKLGPQGAFAAGFMQVFGFQEGGFIPPQMPIVNMAAINENPRRPEVAINMGNRGTAAIPLDKIGKFVEVHTYVTNANPDTQIRTLIKAKPDAFDEIARPISDALTRLERR